MKIESTAQNIEMIDPFAIGRSLKLTDVENLNIQNQQIESRWYQGFPGSDLFVWLNAEKAIIKQQICMSGFVVEWNCLEGLKTGIIVETDMGLPTQDAEKTSVSVNITYDKEVDRFISKLSTDALKNLNEVEALKNELLSNFINPQSIETLAPENFIARYGATLTKLGKSQMGLWDMLKARLHNLFRNQ